ncbi:MAG: FkbM family methyltransferase [bacterium]|nr:FkbM family methyltransferase [bacterium]
MKPRDFIPPIFIKLYRRLRENPEIRRNRINRPEFIGGFWKSYGGKGLEDLFMELLFNFKESGTYVEIGTNDPVTSVSYTQKFYNRGWRGISVEPGIKEFESLQKVRPGDVNLNICIAGEVGERMFYELADSQASSLLPQFASGKGRVSSRKVSVSTLKAIFDKFIKSPIDFMVIDAEGVELEILRSNDWNKYVPKAIILETVHHHYREIVEYLKSHGYIVVYNNHLNSIFVNKKAFENDSRFDVTESRVAIQK